MYCALSDLTTMSQFTRRKKIHINSSVDGALTDHQIKIDIERMSAMQSDFSDIRFNDDSGYLDYWHELCEIIVALRSTGSDIGTPGGLPRIVVADNGTWIMVFRLTSAGAAPSGHEGQVWICNSTDSGETWSSPIKISSDAYDAINAQPIKYPNGDIDIFYTRYDNATSTRHTPNMVARSTDNGVTWSSFSGASAPLGTGHKVMWQAITIGADVYLSLYDVDIATVHCDNILYKTSDNGGTWTKVGDITTHAVNGTYYEAGIVYLGDSTFVSVLRPPTSGTLQRKSIDMGVTWTTQGYIKSDGQVLASGVGTDIRLDQCRIWNKDINGNDLGYVYMFAAFYPGSYPRDNYAYISTNNCDSWNFINVIYTATDYCHDSETVFTSSTTAKYYPSRIAGEGNITADDIVRTISNDAFWIKTDIPSSGGKDIWMYYGNDALLDGGSISDVMVFGDDFNRPDSATVGNGWAETGNTRISENTVTADNSSSSLSRDFPFSSGTFGLMSSIKGLAHERLISMEIRDGAKRSILWRSSATVPPLDDAISFANPDVSLLDPWPLDTWIKCENQRWSSTSFSGYIDNVLTTSGHNPNYTTAENKIYFTVAYDLGSQYWIDWVCVRKLTPNEPTIDVKIEQHQRRTPQIMI